MLKLDKRPLHRRTHTHAGCCVHDRQMHIHPHALWQPRCLSRSLWFKIIYQIKTDSSGKQCKCGCVFAGRPRNNTPPSLPPSQSVTPPLQHPYDAIAPSPEEGFDGELFAVYIPLRYNLGPSLSICMIAKSFIFCPCLREEEKKHRRIEAYQ